MAEPSAFHANLTRGALLLQQDRPREALPFLQAAIAADPNASEGYARLAECWNALPAERSKSISAIERAIGLEPNSSYYFGLKGWLLICQMQYRPALHAAQRGLALDPTCAKSLNAMANAYTKLSQWRKAEETCRRILEISPLDAPGLNLLAQALRRQGKWKESREIVMRLLARQPNNSFGQANAGCDALAAGDHLRANEHFLQALRLDPHSDFARRGLLDSLRARIWINRFNMRMTSWAQRIGASRNASVLKFGLAFSVTLLCFLSLALAALYSQAGGIFFAVPFLLFLFYVWASFLAALIGHFLLLFDPLGRQALTPSEKAKARKIGLVFLIGIVLLLIAGAWTVALVLVFFFALLAFSIQYPLLKDRWQRRREQQVEARSSD